MDIKISYNWLKEYIPKAPAVHQLARALSLHGASVERVTEVIYPLKGVVVGKIVSMEKHPDADKLRVTKVDVGSGAPLTIVCGAPNIQVGQKVPVALTGRAKIKGETLRGAVIRGVGSQGMLCSPFELELSQDHSGIWILSDADDAEKRGSGLRLGTPLETLMPNRDFILDIEVTSNRPDLMSVVGIAREAAAILTIPFNDPFKEKIPSSPRGGKNIRVEVKTKGCSIYQLSVLAEVKVGMSPLIWQVRLYQSGMRPINSVVDATNYVLLEYGQPSHAFSYASTQGKVVVRNARNGERMHALNGKTYALSGDDVLITNGVQILGLAGVMGAEWSGTTQSGDTILETAVFDPVRTRRTMRRHQLYSDAGSLFEKGLTPMLALYSSWRVAKLLGTPIASQVCVKKGVLKPEVVKVDVGWIEARIGVRIGIQECAKLLSRLGCKVKIGKGSLSVGVPWWRQDIHEAIDIVEEIARMYGYYNIKGALPSGALPSVASDSVFSHEIAIKQLLARYGYSEVITNPFVARDYGGAVKMLNPLQEELPYLRTSLLQTVLGVVAENEHRASEIKVFEIGRIYRAVSKKLPNEPYELIVCAAGHSPEQVYREVRGAMQSLIVERGLSGVAREQEGVDNSVLMHGSREVGTCGVVSKQVARGYGIKKAVAYFSLDIEYLHHHMRERFDFARSMELPPVKRDISFVVRKEIRYTDIQGVIDGLDSLLVHYELFDTFALQGDTVSWGIHLYFASPDRTLRENDITQLEDKIIKALENKLSAYVRSKTH